MGKKMVVSALIFILLIVGSVDMILRTGYNTNLKEFFGINGSLTEEEREWLQSYGEIIYGSDQYAPPLRFQDPKTGQYKGIIVDYINALSIELGKEIQVQPLVWEEALASLAKGETQIADMYPSEERAEHFLFSKPIYNQRGIILIPVDNDQIKHYDHLKNKTVAAQKGDYVNGFLESRVEQVTFRHVPNYKEGIRLLKSGEVDAVVGDEPVISFMLDQMGISDEYKIAENPLYEIESVLAVPQSEKKLLSILNKGIASLNQKETMTDIQRKWFGISAPFIKERVSERTVISVGGILSIFAMAMLLIYAWNNQLKKEVEKRTEELFVSRNDLETTFNGLTHLMVVVDKDCGILNVNKAFCELIQHTSDEIIGKNCKDYPGLLHTSCNECLMKKTLIKEKDFRKEMEYDNRIYEKTTFPLKDKERKTERVLIMIKDMTDLRIGEQQLLHANKMAAIGQLAAGVAHEIRNPLGLIRSYCYLLKENISMQDSLNQKAIDVIESSVKKSSNVIDNLLNFSRLTEDKKEKVHLHEVIANVMNLESKEMKNKNIRKEVICKVDSQCYINQEAMKHILINLISNAIDAMPEGGRLTIGCEKQQDRLLLSCSDTGIGIEAENQEKIFNPFFTTKAMGKGTGLGLYIVYNEVKKLAGKIQVESIPGEGTTFRISLPLEGGEDGNESA
ncbi:amino acid-binding domain sensor histidine kinase [Tindallia magadiensis]|uniref:histidine kinase n=1 Tax=Tindallia magadiensis TaxID=69895 RepID=A0A1I3GSD7_9FIRM|nr:transporter substrate-binding domain-containing protein [Tindallia magadiensis]SFI26310.1 amino acid-binding domain sensor histidine kinase [Tindallia magadiensis]